MVVDSGNSTSLRQAAIVLAAMGEDLAAEACSRLPVSQVLRLGEEIARLGWVPREELEQALDAFTSSGANVTRLGGTAYARTMLDATIGIAHAPGAYSQELEGLTVLSELDDIPSPLLHRVLMNEDPQVIATVVSNLTPARAGALLANYEETAAADVAYRAAHISTISPGALQALAVALDLELSGVGGRDETSREVSLQYVVELVDSLPSAKSKALLEALGRINQDFGESVAEQVFTFDDVISLSDADLQTLLRSVDMGILVTGLKGTSTELRERVRANLSQRGRERLTEEMEMLGPVPLSQVQDAQRQLCAEARALAERGEISLDSGTEEYVE